MFRFGTGALAFLLLFAALALLMQADAPAIRFIDVAAQAGLTIPNTFGGKEKKDFILESTGTGAAIFDYNGDGANDVFIANGTVFQPTGAADPLATLPQRRQRALYRGRSTGRTDAHRVGASRLHRRFR